MKFMGCQRAIQSAGERAGWGDLVGLGEREVRWIFGACNESRTLFTHSLSRFDSHIHSIRTRTHFADYLIAANVSTKAASKSTKQNSNSSKAQAWNACALILERGRGGAQGGGICSKAMPTVLHIVIGASSFLNAALPILDESKKLI